MPTYKEPCGCKHDGHKWLELCATDQAEHTERHERAKNDRRASIERDKRERERREMLAELGVSA